MSVINKMRRAKGVKYNTFVPKNQRQNTPKTNKMKGGNNNANLINAAQTGDLATVQSYIERGVDIDFKNNIGYTTLMQVTMVT